MVPDRARACPTCALRVRERACPECGAPTLDLRDRTTRRVVAQQLAAQPGTAPPEGVVGDVVAAYLRWGVPLLSLVGAGVLTYLHGVAAAFLGMLMVFFGQVVMVPLVAGSVAVVSHVALGRRGRPARALRIHDEREPTLDHYVELVGVVRALRPVSSPLSHAPCVAYRPWTKRARASCTSKPTTGEPCGSTLAARRSGSRRRPRPTRSCVPTPRSRACSTNARSLLRVVPCGSPSVCSKTVRECVREACSAACAPKTATAATTTRRPSKPSRCWTPERFHDERAASVGVDVVVYVVVVGDVNAIGLHVTRREGAGTNAPPRPLNEARGG